MENKALINLTDPTLALPQLISPKILAMSLVMALSMSAVVYLGNLRSSKLDATPAPAKFVAARRALAKQMVKYTETANHKNLVLYSIKKEYTYVFTGQLVGQTQGAMVKVNVSTLQNHITKTAMINTDGSYNVEVKLTEVPREQIEWTLTARTPNTDPTEVSGSQILTEEDPTVTVAQPINL